MAPAIRDGLGLLTWSQDSFAYADSITDMGLFNIVGNPRPVYPDAELTQVAKEKGWPVLGTPVVE